MEARRESSQQFVTLSLTYLLISKPHHMFKFFRNLRRGFLEENRIGKYLKYAFGEVILVVIGILIALQLNNLNEQDKLRKAEKVLLEDLLEEMNFNLEEIERARQINSVNIEGTGEFLSLFPPEIHQEKTDIEIALTLTKSLQEKTEFHPRFSVINSGRLDLLSNNSLRNDLLRLPPSVDRFNDAERTVIQIRWECTQLVTEIGNMRRNIDSIMDTSGWYSTPTSAFENTTRELFKSRVFENKLTLFLATSINADQIFLSPMNDSLQVIQKRIIKELERDF